MLKLEIEWRKEEALREYMLGLERLYAEIQALVSTLRARRAASSSCS